MCNPVTRWLYLIYTQNILPSVAYVFQCKLLGFFLNTVTVLLHFLIEGHISKLARQQNQSFYQLRISDIAELCEQKN